MESAKLDQDRIRTLVARFLEGEGSAFDPIYHEYKGPLYRMAAARLGPGADAEDCLQVAFVKIARALTTYDASRPFFSWACRILVNVVTDRLRQRWATRLLAEEELASIPSPPPTATDAERRDRVALEDARAVRVREVLASLPEDQRKRVMLFYFQGLSHAEIARVMQDSSEENARQKLKRIRDRLRGLLGSPDVLEAQS